MKDQINTELLEERLSDGVLEVHLGRGKAHALSLDLILALKEVFERAGKSDDVRALIVYGEGRIFCAGHDLKEITARRADADDGRAYLEELFGACSEMMMALAEMPKPTVAVVEGIATAAGLQLASSCDLVFAEEGASVCLPGVKNGGFCTTPAVAVARKTGKGQLMELALSGETFEAAWARGAGLFNRVFAAGEALGEARKFTATLASRHPQAMSDGKMAALRQIEMPLGEAYADATPAMIGHFMDPVRIAEEKRDWS